MEDFPVAALAKANMYLTTKFATVIGAPVTGYCFIKDKDAVWFESTSEMEVAFETAGLKHPGKLLPGGVGKSTGNKISGK